MNQYLYDVFLLSFQLTIKSLLLRVSANSKNCKNFVTITLKYYA